MQILHIAEKAIERELDRLSASAARVATPIDPENPADAPDLAREAATRIESTAATKANLKVIKSEDDRLKQLLDIFA